MKRIIILILALMLLIVGCQSPSKDATATKEHYFVSTKVEPTCTEDGYTAFTCTRCYFSYQENIVPATGHSFKTSADGTSKTCTACEYTESLPYTGGELETLSVHYIDVGQGDCIFIKVGDCDIIIDAGYSEMGSRVTNYLKSLGVDDIELMINTHAHADHYGGLPAVLRAYVVEEVWVSPLDSTNGGYKSFLTAVKNEGAIKKSPSKGTVYTYKGLTLTVIYDGSGTDDYNESSLVVMLQYGSKKFLFTGDIGTSTENKLVKSNVNIQCDVLKVAHHGSAGSSAKDFVKATGATYGVIGVGAGNDYGHPTSAALNRLSSANISVYRTDKHGNVVFSTNGITLSTPVINASAEATNLVEPFTFATANFQISVDLSLIKKMRDSFSVIA